MMFGKIKINLPLDKTEIKVKKDSELVEVLKNHKVRPFFGCESGLCGTCVSTIRGNLAEKSEREKQTLERINAKPNQRLVCQLKATDACTILPQYADAAKRIWIEPTEDGWKEIWMDKKHNPRDFMFMK